MTPKPEPPAARAPTDCLSGGGEMGALMRSMDWSKTALGAVDSWPQSLRTSVSTCLNSRFPILIWWGPDLIKIYNDAYRFILGDKHPRSMGQRGRDCWPEIWHIIGPMLEGVLMQGQATWSENQLLVLERHGFPEECYFTFSYSPIRDESGIAGVYCAVTETTRQVLGERRLKTLRDLGERGLLKPETVEQACQARAAALAGNAHDFPFALIYLMDEDGKHTRLAATVNLPEDFESGPAKAAIGSRDDVWNFRGIIETNQRAVVEKLEEKFGPMPAGPWKDECTKRALLLPLAKAGVQESPAGFLVAGLSPRLALDHEYRSFLELAAGQLATAIANARAYELERKRAEALAELDRAKTAFFSNVSHEFRTPLTLMLGPLEDTLARSDVLATEDRERLEVAHRNSLRLLKLVNTLLDFSRIEAGRIEASYEPTDLAAFTEELASVFRSATERAGLQLAVNCPPLAEPVYVDREMWEKIVLNLLSNAFKFTFEGEIEVSLRQAGETVELAVRDTGTGIPAEELPRVFERFHRIKAARGRTFEGSGIGLALVQELAKLHGGAVRVESELDRGSVFTVSILRGKAHLPPERIEAVRTLASNSVRGEAYVEEVLRWLPDTAARENAPLPLATSAVREPGMQRAAGSGSLPRVLLADDNADMREYVRRLLSRHYEVEAFADGRAALDAARERAPDLVLTDVMMPELDGFGLLQQLRADERTATVPVIMLSARAGEEARVEGMTAGADDYVVKPFSARELIARIGAHLEIARIRRDADQKLRESEERYRSMVGLLPVAVYTCEAPTGVITYYNDHAAKLWSRAPKPGDTDERFCGSFRLWKPDGSPLAHDETPMAFALHQGREFRNEDVIIERPDGTRINVLVNINPIRDATGRIIGAVNAFQDTTALTQAQEQVKEQQRNLQLTTDAAQVGTWQWNTKTGDLVWSAIHKKLWGYEPTPDPIRYEDWARLIDKRDLARAEQAVQDSLRSKSEYDVEYRIKPQGTTEARWIRSIGRPFIDSMDEAVLLRGVSFDVTQRKKAEEALRHRTEQFETLLSKAPLGVYLVDADFRIREVNPVALPVFGDIPGGVAGRDFDEIMHILWEKRYADEIVQIFRHTLETGEPYITQESVEFRIDLGVTEYHEWRLERITLPEGRYGLVCYFRDISEQVRARQAIAESEQRFRAIADTMPQIVWAARADGDIDYYNERWYEYTGLPTGELGQSGWRSTLHADDLAASIDTYFDCVREGKPYQIECRFRDRKTGGYRWFMGRALPIRDENGRIARWFGTFTDIDDQKRLEAELRQADRRKDEFLAMLGHELRNPLAAISTGTAVLQLDPPQERRDWVEGMIARQVNRLQRLVDDLLDVTRITEGKIQLRKEVIELAQAAEDAVESVRDLLDQRRHQFSVSLAPGPLQLLADPARIEQILVNLLTNAAKYTPDGGKIELLAERSGSEVVIRCRDNGVGLTQEMLSHAFDAFVQGDFPPEHVVSGLGMGLTLVRRLVEMHSGTVTAVSAGPGKGSEFVVRLPALPAAQSGTANETEQRASEITPLSLGILVIDDNRDLAESLALFLRNAGHRVRVAHDGETGIACAAKENPDVVLLDLGLPGIDGYTIAERMRATDTLQNTTIVAVSGYPPVSDERTRRAQFDAHVVKPIAYGRLLDLLQEKLAHGPGASSG